SAAAAQAQAETLLTALHAAASHEGAVWVITRGASGPGAPESLAGSMAQALARVFALEHPTRWGGAIDLPLDATAADFVTRDRLIAAGRHAGRDDDGFLAVRDGRAFVPRLVPAEKVSSSAVPHVSSDA